MSEDNELRRGGDRLRPDRRDRGEPARAAWVCTLSSSSATRMSTRGLAPSPPTRRSCGSGSRSGWPSGCKQDMLPDRPIDFVDADGRAVRRADHHAAAARPSAAAVHLPARASTSVLRDGVDRYPNVEVLLEHECLRVRQDERRRRTHSLADLRTDTFNRLRASYVIAADGGSSPIRAQLNVGYEGRTYEDRWVVIDTKVIQGVGRPRPAAVPLRSGPPDRRLPDAAGSPPLGVPGPRRRGRETTSSPTRPSGSCSPVQGITEDNVKILRAVVYSHHVRFADRWRVGGCSWPATPRTPCRRGSVRACPPECATSANLCWKLAAVVRGQAPDALLDRYEAERKPQVSEVTRRAVHGRPDHHRTPSTSSPGAQPAAARADAAASRGACWEQLWIPRRATATGLRASTRRGGRSADPATVGDRRDR